MKRYDRLKEIRRLDPERDFLRIYRITATLEFPWDITRALELALYRTYAVPSIGRLLAGTGEFSGRPQKRYDDTALLLDTVVEYGFDSESGRTAIRRINQMHRSYDISNDDMRYVLCTFVVAPRRWVDAYGWRRLSGHERHAIAVYYRTLGKHMGIQDVPGSYDEFERCLEDYEAEHFGWDEGGRRVSDATLDLMASWYPRPLAPLVRGASMALLDDSLLNAFRYEQPHPATRALVRGALRARGRAVRLLPPRRTPHYTRQNPEIKGYPDGYVVAELGTFPAGRRGAVCPVPHGRSATDSATAGTAGAGAAGAASDPAGSGSDAAE
ncbi:oxygenase MpaB family protein [Streptomyces roseoverticillatus]|uniref:Oxygenase MpaB family protein n=1 Tax=Streptomyces roseoverticillatus TaxID=66429 RepID=A0ABV3IQA4_9ACTN